MKTGLFLTTIIAYLLLVVSCTHPPTKLKEAPDSFKAKFETTKGTFIVQFYRKWSPHGVDRVHQLIKSGFYDNVAIFRVVDNYVAQFGISNDSTLNSFWKQRELLDELVVTNNTEGTLAFARGGPNTRGTQLFINLKNNSPRLDTLNYSNVAGFPVIGKFIEGENVASSLYAGYGNTPRQDSIHVYGNNYLLRNFPDLDYIQKTTILK